MSEEGKLVWLEKGKAYIAEAEPEETMVGSDLCKGCAFRHTKVNGVCEEAPEVVMKNRANPIWCSELNLIWKEVDV